MSGQQWSSMAVDTHTILTWDSMTVNKNYEQTDPLICCRNSLQSSVKTLLKLFHSQTGKIISLWSFVHSRMDVETRTGLTEVLEASVHVAYTITGTVCPLVHAYFLVDNISLLPLLQIHPRP